MNSLFSKDRSKMTELWWFQFWSHVSECGKIIVSSRSSSGTFMGLVNEWEDSEHN